MPKLKTRHQILTSHFFRRFFDNDTLSIEGETETTIVRALAFCAIPGLMFAFWLMPTYPNRPLWTVASDRYFFVLFSFIAMGIATTFEWEMLFPDRADFLILLPLGLKPRELFYAKARALLTFLALFLAATNIFSSILFPAVSTASHGSYLHSIVAHCAAVTLAGTFAAFTMLAIEGLALSLLPSAWFRTVSTLLQCLSIAVLLLLLLLYPVISSRLQLLLEGNATLAIWVPPLWFLGLYQHLMLGSAAPANALLLANLGLYATATAVLIAVATYPLAWSRQKKRALEGASQSRTQFSTPLGALMHKTLLRKPQQRAIFHFIAQTVTRNPGYQLFLAIYAGAGLAIALCCTLTLRQNGDHTLTPTIWNPGLHTILPLLLFWLILGLKSAFAAPVDMRARWVFPISLAQSNSYTGIFPGPSAKTARLVTQICCALLTVAILSLLLALHWSYLDLLIQAVAGIALTLLLSNLFFLGRTQIPFTRPRMPGRSSLPLVLTLYAAFFPAIVLFTVKLEQAAELHPFVLLWIVLTSAALFVLLTWLDQLAQEGVIGGFPEDETDQGPQTLGLFQ